MILINKGRPPDTLVRAGRARASAHCAEHDADPSAFKKKRPAKIDFSAGVYGHASVRAALQAAQHGKCCYCEVVVPKPYASVHVEHWRPKASVRQDEATPEIRPGYYWLAYDWDNLFLACRPCNLSKGVFFPLADPSLRADPTQRDLSIETPLLLKPDGPDDPTDHIGFEEEVAVGKTDRGCRTVEIVGLDESKHERRRECLTRLQRTWRIMLQYQVGRSLDSDRILQLARRVIDVSLGPEAEYSGMARVFVDAHFQTIGGKLLARTTTRRKQAKRKAAP